MEALTEALQATVMRWKCKFPAPLPLELYTSSNFIGLFVKEDSAEVLKKFAADFAAEAASKAGEWLSPWVGTVRKYRVWMPRRSPAWALSEKPNFGVMKKPSLGIVRKPKFRCPEGAQLGH